MDKRKFNEQDRRVYRKFADAHAPKSNTFVDCVRAFFVGGAICTVGQGISDIYKYLGIAEDAVNTLTPVTLIFLSVLMTGIGIYEKIAKKAGGGTLVPITGFANAVASPAIDSKCEGFVLGVGSEMFKIAGPVILYGTAASVIYGVFYYFTMI